LRADRRVNSANGFPFAVDVDVDFDVDVAGDSERVECQGSARLNRRPKQWH